MKEVIIIPMFKIDNSFIEYIHTIVHTNRLIICVDDHQNDQSLMKQIHEIPGCIVICHTHSQGRDACIYSGIQYVKQFNIPISNIGITKKGSMHIREVISLNNTEPQLRMGSNQLQQILSLENSVRFEQKIKKILKERRKENRASVWLIKHHNDLFIIALFCLVYIGFVYTLTRNDSYYASTLDYQTQHMLFPDYLRQLFYDTKDLFPDFMPHIGAGQNIFNITYYGLYSPIIFISYCLPNVSMIDYLIMSMHIIVVGSAILFYFFLRKNKCSEMIALIVSFMYLFASPVLFHSHRHIMFVNYLLFLMMGLFGVHRFIEKQKSGLLICSLLLLVTTNYLYGFASFLMLYSYCLYRSRLSSYFKTVFYYSVPFLLSAGMSAMLLLPTLYTLLTNRNASNVDISIIELFTPNFDMLYDPYSLGISIPSLLLLVVVAIAGKRKQKRMSLFLLIVMSFPIFNFILNGFMYDNPKSLIPFLPLVLLFAAYGLQIIWDNLRSVVKIMVGGYLVLSTGMISYQTSATDTLIDKSTLTEQEQQYAYYYEYLATYDSGMYRISNQLNGVNTVNFVNGMQEYSSSIYASTSSKIYEYFNEKVMMNEIPYRNDFIIASSNNYFSQMLLAEKYIITKQQLGVGYVLIHEYENIFIYQNVNAYPYAYVAEELNYMQLFEETKIEASILSKKHVQIKTDGESVTIDSQTDGLMEVKLDGINKNQFLKIQFDLKPQKNDLRMEINGIVNKLTSQTWKYYNHNETFTYVLTKNDVLNIELSKGVYEISNVSMSVLDYDLINQDAIIPLQIDTNTTQKEIVSGHIQLSSDSVLHVSVPYDVGFSVLVNGESTMYEKSELGFISIPIKKGTNAIQISYHAPYKREGIAVSLISIILCIIYKMKEGKRDEKNN